MAEPRDEVSYSDYRRACRRMEIAAEALGMGADPDEAAQHWLPELVKHVAVIFSFVGSNMTARHMRHYGETVAALEAAKQGILPPDPSS